MPNYTTYRYMYIDFNYDYNAIFVHNLAINFDSVTSPEFTVPVSFGFLIYLVIITSGKLFLGDIISRASGTHRSILKTLYSVRDASSSIFSWCKGATMYVFFLTPTYL